MGRPQNIGQFYKGNILNWAAFLVLIASLVCAPTHIAYAQALFSDDEIQLAIKNAEDLRQRKQATLKELTAQLPVLLEDTLLKAPLDPEKITEVEIGSGVTMGFCFIPSTLSESWKKMSGGKRTFTMGSPLGESYRENNEKTHEVCLAKGFWMGKFEVTQEQWESVMGSNPSVFKDPKCPVENVSWDDCQRFIWKIQKKHQNAGGLVFRLPTEAEWEYACRAGSTGPYYADLASIAWFREGFYKGDAKVEEPHPVGQKAANVWGVHDMHGNVWEWCSDWYFTDYPAGLVADPEGKEFGPSHVKRGGCWGNNANKCRAAYRYYVIENNSNFNIGVRLVMTLP